MTSFEGLINVADGQIRVAKGRRIRAFINRLADIAEQLGIRGLVVSSVHAVQAGRYAASEVEAWAEEWMGVFDRTLNSSGQPWTDDVSAEVRSYLDREVRSNTQRLEGLVRDHLPKGVDPYLTELWEARDRACNYIQSEVDLRRYAANHQDFELRDKLAPPRYDAVRGEWQKALEAHERSPGTAEAIQSAIKSVEELARVVNRTPKKTLGEIIKDLRERDGIDAPMLKGLEELWGWSSDQVRHGAKEINEVSARYVHRLAEAGMHLLLDFDAL